MRSAKTNAPAAILMTAATWLVVGAPGAGEQAQDRFQASKRAMTENNSSSKTKAKKVPGGWKLPGDPTVYPYDPTVPPDMVNPRPPRPDRPNAPKRPRQG